MNLLILSCGTRDLLVRYFRKSSFDKIVVTDCSRLAPALYEADSYHIVPRMDAPDYLDAILTVCRKEKINMVLPLQEDELNWLALHRKSFEEKGILPVVSDSSALEICRDKFRFFEYLRDNGIPVLATYVELKAFNEDLKAGKINFPVFIKPVRGCGSIGAMKVASMEVLEVLCRNADAPLLIQEFCQGREFGADSYVDLLSHEIVDIFVKEKLRMRAGETEKSVTYQDKALQQLIAHTLESLPLAGPVDMDIFEKDGKYFISEINPRFGGGYPHAYVNGMNVPEYLYENCKGKRNVQNLNACREELYVMKYSDIMVSAIR